MLDPAACILLDLSAVLDTGNHQNLSIVQELEVSGSALSLFTSYLKGHTYRVISRQSVYKSCSLATGSLRVLSWVHSSLLNLVPVNGEVMDERCIPWKEKQFSLVEALLTTQMPFPTTAMEMTLII